MADNPFPWLTGGGDGGTATASSSNDKDFQDFLDRAAKGSAGNSVSAPASQEWILMPLSKGGAPPADGPQNIDIPPGFAWYHNPGFTGKAGTTSVQKTDDGRIVSVTGGVATQVWPPGGEAPPAKPVPPSQQGQIVSGQLYVPDATGKWNSVTPPTPEDALKIQQIGERERNAALTGRYMTDDESVKYQAAVNNLGYDAQKAAQLQKDTESKLRQADQDYRQKAALFPGTVEKQGVDIEDVRAATAARNASTTQTLQNVDIAAARLPYDLQQATATRLGTEASTAGTQATTAQTKQATQIAGAPRTVDTTLGTATPMVAQTNPLTGAVTYTQNPNYQPKTAAEIAARVGQIQTTMQAKQNEVQGKVGQMVDGKLYTADDALKEFNAWHATNVKPQTDALLQAQQDAELQRAKDVSGMRTQEYNAASQAGTQAINAARENKSGRVGPGFGNLMNAITSGKGLVGPGVDVGSAFTFQAPEVDPNQAVMQALKYVSPTAAQATGSPMPNYGGVNIQQTLGAMPYWPNGAPPAPAAPGATAVAEAGAPGGPGSPGFDWSGLMQRQQDDVAAQQRQAQVPAMTPPPSPLPGQNYGPGQGYSGGVAPWNFNPNMLPNYALPY